MYNKNLYKKIFWISLLFGLFTLVGNTFAAKDIMEVMFEPAKTHEKIIDLGTTKTAVGNEVFRESTQLGFDVNFSNICTVNWQRISEWVLSDQAKSNWYNGNNSDYCEQVLWGDYEKHLISWTSQTQAPLIVRITKLLLRLTVVLAITMVLYNGIKWIVESAKWGDVKEAKENLIYIIGGILLALSSVALINLISSVSISSLNIEEKENTDQSLSEVVNKAADYVGDKFK